MISIDGVQVDIVVVITSIVGFIIASATLKKALQTLNPFKWIKDGFKAQEKMNADFMIYFKKDKEAIEELQKNQKETDMKYQKVVDNNSIISKALMAILMSLAKNNNDHELTRLHNELTNEMTNLHAKYDKSSD